MLTRRENNLLLLGWLKCTHMHNTHKETHWLRNNTSTSALRVLVLLSVFAHVIRIHCYLPCGAEHLRLITIISLS